MVNYIVLGRFQPFHFGHEFLVSKALDLAKEEDKVTICIGSGQAGGDMQNPWFSDERKEMIQAWIAHKNIEKSVDIVIVDDINDPPNWVNHATKSHGEGILVTSDESTIQLYENSGFETIQIILDNRENLAGWRVRNTAKMVSTIYDEQAIRQVLGQSLPEPILDWLIENDALFRLSTMVGAVVG